MRKKFPFFSILPLRRALRKLVLRYPWINKFFPWYLKIRHKIASRFYFFSEERRVEKYNDAFFLNREIPEFMAYKRHLIRPGDMGACICYAYGCTNYYEVQIIFDMPKDNPRFLPNDNNHRQQLARIKKHSKRNPELVVSIGAGRGEMESMFLLDGVRCIGIDPSPAAERIYRKTINEWAGISDCEFLNLGAYEGFLKLWESSIIPDTVIFCESIEHIPEKELVRTINLIRKALTQTSGMLIIANWIDFHPILPDGTGWDHITPIDDVFYDKISQLAKRVIFRKGSHLVLQF